MQPGGAENLRLAGVPAVEISALWPWECYNGAFDDWVQQGGLERVLAAEPLIRSDVTNDFWGRFLRQRYRQASYKLVHSSRLETPGRDAPRSWRIRGSIPYRDMFLREQNIYIVWDSSAG